MDYLLELSKSAGARNLVRTLGLPLPMPPVLRRGKEPWAERILNDETVVVGAHAPTALLEAVASVIAPAGGRVIWTGAQASDGTFAQPAEAWAEPVVYRAEPDDTTRVSALVYDASAITNPAQLASLYEFFHAWVGALAKNGRVVVLARPTPEAPVEAAAQAGIEGFVRSLSKELGRKGTTANLLRVASGAEDRVAGPLRFFLSRYSAFVTGQPLGVSSLVRANAVGEQRQSLAGKVALVTGASRGIGAQTASTLAREGAHVVILDRPGAETEASQLARRLGASLLLVDITEEGAGDRIVELAEQKGGLDIVVHNAGVTRDKTLRRMSREAWDMVIDVNLRAALQTTERVLAAGVLRDEGRLIVLSSVGGIAGNPGQTNYGASKAALIGYTRALAQQLADRGITVNAIAPGLIETKMTAKMPVGVREAARRLSSLNQGGLPTDVAEAITFLALPVAHGCSGQVLRVCGGALIGA